MSYEKDSHRDAQLREGCIEVSSLLQPFVDGELGDAEHHNVLEHLSNCRDCNHLVREQQAVRGLLRQMQRPVAPAALRARVFAALDAVDAERESHPAAAQDLASEIPAPTPGRANEAQNPPATVIPLAQKLRERLSALSKGALIMLPAAAAAALMWVAIDRPPGQQPPLPSASGLQSIWSSDRDQPVIPPILGPTRLPEGVEFVSAHPNQVRYRHASGLEFIDQRHNGQNAPQERDPHFVEDHGLRYRLLHDELGHPQIEFFVGGAARRLTAVPFDSPSPRQGNSDPEINTLLQLARALSQAQP